MMEAITVGAKIKMTASITSDYPIRLYCNDHLHRRNGQSVRRMV